MKEKITKVLVTGSPRCGTSVLTNYLNANKECVFMRDSLLAIFRVSWKLGIRSFTEFLPIHSRNIILRNLKAEMMLMAIDKLNNLQITQFTTLEELFDVSMELFVDDDTKVFGVKVTETEHWFETLIKETDMKMICVVRDLRDVLLSSANAFTGYKRSYYSRRWFRGITEALKNDDASRLILIRFEDLILNPERTLKLLSAFLGVKFHSNVKQIKDVTGTVFRDNSSFHDVTKLFDPITVNRWKKILDSKEVIYGSVVYEKLMKKLGYEENPIPFLKGLKLRIAGFWELKRMTIRNLLFFILLRKVIRKARGLFRNLGKKITLAMREEEK